MNFYKTGMMLALVSSTAWAQVGGLMNAEVSTQTSIDDPSIAVQTVKEDWLAFSMPVLEGTRSPCCWTGKWNSQREVGCSLETQDESYGTRSDSPLADHIIAYVRINQGEVSSLRLVGEQCPVEGEGAKVTWIGGTDDTASLNWLESVARSNNHDSAETALYAMALHRSKKASEHLQALAKEPNGDLAEEAIDLLSAISRTDSDPEQRGNALFWLADEFPELAHDLLLESIAGEQNEDVLEQAVFAISHLPNETSRQMLLDLASNDRYPREVRRQALFWLANSDDEEAVAALAELLTR